MNILKSKWLIVLVLGAISYIGTTLFLLNKFPLKPIKSEKDYPIVGNLENKHASWNFYNPELDQLIADLTREKEILDKRAQELKDLETRVKAEHAELLQLTQTVWQLRQDFEKDIVKIKEEEVSNLKKLAKIYSTMSPEGAAKIMAELPDDMIVKVLVFMKESESAQILEVLGKSSSTEAKRVAMITEMLRLASQKVATNKTI